MDEKYKLQKSKVKKGGSDTANDGNKSVYTPADSQAILNAIPDLIFRISREGVYLDYKQANNIPLLLKPEEFLGKSIFNVVPESIAQRTIQAIEKVALTHEQVNFTYQLKIDGESHNYEARIVESDPNNEFLIIVRDVTVQDNILNELEEN